MRRTSVAAALAALALAAFPAPSASALGQAPRLVADWGAPAAPPAHVQFTVDVRTTGGVRFDSSLHRVRRVRVVLVDPSAPAGQRVVDELCSQTFVDAGVLTYDLDLSWDTRRLQTSALRSCVGGARATEFDGQLANGAYRLRLTGTDTLLGTSDSVERAVKISNPPEPPGGVSASFLTDPQAITVLWSSNPEPDLAGYVVERCRTAGPGEACPAGGWSPVASPPAGTTSASTPVTEPGAYWHRVSAVRPDADGSTQLTSLPSTAAPVVLDAAGGEGEAPVSDPVSDGPASEGEDPGARDRADSNEASLRPGRAGGAASSDGDRARSAGTPDAAASPRLIQRPMPDPGYSAVDGGHSVDDVAADTRRFSSGRDQRAVGLVLIAAGLLLLVVSMQMRYLNRRLPVAEPDRPHAPA